MTPRTIRGSLAVTTGIVATAVLFGWMVSATEADAGGLGLPHPDVMRQSGWWGPFDINNRAFAGFSVNSGGAASISFYDRFGNRKASISLIPDSDDEETAGNPVPSSTEIRRE